MLYKCLLSIADVTPRNHFCYLLLSVHFVNSLAASDEQRKDKLLEIRGDDARGAQCVHRESQPVGRQDVGFWVRAVVLVNSSETKGVYKYKFHIGLSLLLLD